MVHVQHGKDQIGCNSLFRRGKVLDNVIIRCFEEAKISGTERDSDVNLACGEHRAPHVDVGAKTVLHLQQGLSG